MTITVNPHSQKVDLFGYVFDPLTMDDVVNRCAGAVTRRDRMLIGVANAAKIVNMRSDALLRSSVLGCDLLIADGQSLVWASRLLGRPLPERVTGIDLFERLLAYADDHRRSVYLLGAKPSVLAAVEDRVAERFPNVKIAGSRDGYFSEAEAPRIAEEIRQSGADMLFLGITSPKKEVFLGAHADSLDVPILHGVGGSFDIIAGVTKRAPISWQRCGCEWLFRLLQEPRRMWRRYLNTNTVFVLMTLHELVRPGGRTHQHTTTRPNRSGRKS